MDFSFNEEQQEFARLVHEYLGQHLSASTLRAQWEDGGHANSDIFAMLAEVGVAAPTISEEYGGLGRDGLDLPLVFESFGYFGVAESVAFTIGVVAPFLARFADEKTKRQWLPRIAEGSALCAVQVDGDRAVLGASTADLFLITRSSHVHLVTRERAAV